MGFGMFWSWKNDKNMQLYAIIQGDFGPEFTFYHVYPTLAQAVGPWLSESCPKKKGPSFRLQLALLHLLQNLQSYGPRSSILEGAQGGIESDHIGLLGANKSHHLIYMLFTVLQLYVYSQP